MKALDRLALAALVALAVALPFELETPWLRLAGVEITNLEVLLGLALLLAGLAWWRRGRPALGIPRSWAVLALLFAMALLLSSMLAPALGDNALKAAMRTLSGMALVGIVATAVTSRRDWLAVCAGLVGGGLLAALIGSAELLRGTALEWLVVFRLRPTVAGPFLRLSGPFDYANQAAMFIEATLPLLVAFAVLAWRRRHGMWTAVLALALLLYLQAAFLTFSRASFATLLIVNLVLAGWLWLAPGQRRQSALWGTVAAVIVVLIGLNLALSPVFRLRLTSEGDSAWYQARISVPAQITLPVDAKTDVRVTVENTGSLTWDSSSVNPIRLGWRWQEAGGGTELAYQPRWPFPRPVRPGEVVTLDVPVRAPQRGGDYVLVWDLVHENVTWFAAKNDTAQRSRVTVTGSDASPGSGGQVTKQRVEVLKFEPPIPGRRALWGAALRQTAQHPLFGIGLDNFRLTYGPLLGMAQWNETVHSNNWYLETLVSLGIVGSLPFFVWLGLLTIDMARTLRQPRTGIWVTAVAAGLLAFFVHGLLDYFMLFNATAWLFWLLVGLWQRTKTLPEVG